MHSKHDHESPAAIKIDKNNSPMIEIECNEEVPFNSSGNSAIGMPELRGFSTAGKSVTGVAGVEGMMFFEGKLLQLKPTTYSELKEKSERIFIRTIFKYAHDTN